MAHALKVVSVLCVGCMIGFAHVSEEKKGRPTFCNQWWHCGPTVIDPGAEVFALLMILYGSSSGKSCPTAQD
ncbi:hypothetical protein GUJ93_ZPchr0002g24626 [Zizania palustris]|uniref:Uncharacterized protein n=1 Tax=Zizania palustris TaxID=103762 RepID=A0A8J5S5P5_ZIZPA|nr:hypothetical protein GUJ93_ZPchr0002g24626 [Zizania palustris]